MQYLDSLVLMIAKFSACRYKVLLTNTRWEKLRPSQISQVQCGVYKLCISCHWNGWPEDCRRDVVPLFFFFTQINLLWASQRDHMERGNVTKISMNISKSSNLSNLHVWDVCCLYRLSEHFVNYKVFIVRWDSIPPQRHAVTNITGTAAQGIVLFKRSYTLFLASV